MNPWIPYHMVTANQTMYLSGKEWSTVRRDGLVTKNEIWETERSEMFGHYRMVSGDRIEIRTYTNHTVKVPANAVTVRPITEEILDSAIICLRIPNRGGKRYTEEQLRKIIGI